MTLLNSHKFNDTINKTIFKEMLVLKESCMSIYKERGRFLVESVKVMCYKLKTVPSRMIKIYVNF